MKENVTIMITIQEINAYFLKIPLTTPWKIAYSTDTHCETAIVEIISDNGLKGYGEASPSTEVTGDTSKSILAVIEMLKPQMIGENPLELRKLIDDMDRSLAYNTAAKAGLDMALHDLAAKYYQVPLKTLLGGQCRDKVVTSLTAWMGSVEETVKRVEFLLQQGAQVSKVKIGLDVPLDIARIKAIRETFGYDFKIRTDANQGYTPRETVEFLEKTVENQIEFIEQPTPHEDVSGLKFVTQHSPVPVMADETIHSPADAIRLCHERACDLINIKVMKAGGLLRAQEIATIAQAANMGCMLGAMLETKVGMAAATHLALSHPNILYADLDGHFDLADDPTIGEFEIKNGCNYVPDIPGIGVELDHAKIKKYLVQ